KGSFVMTHTRFAHSALALAAALAIVPLAHAQVAPAAQNAGFAIADEIRASRTASVTYAVNFQQQRQLDASTAAQAALAQALAQAGQPMLAPHPGQGAAAPAPVFGPGLVAETAASAQQTQPGGLVAEPVPAGQTR